MGSRFARRVAEGVPACAAGAAFAQRAAPRDREPTPATVSGRLSRRGQSGRRGSASACGVFQPIRTFRTIEFAKIFSKYEHLETHEPDEIALSGDVIGTQNSRHDVDSGPFRQRPRRDDGQGRERQLSDDGRADEADCQTAFDEARERDYSIVAPFDSMMRPERKSPRPVGFRVARFMVGATWQKARIQYRNIGRRRVLEARDRRLRRQALSHSSIIRVTGTHEPPAPPSMLHRDVALVATTGDSTGPSANRFQALSYESICLA